MSDITSGTTAIPPVFRAALTDLGTGLRRVAPPIVAAGLLLVAWDLLCRSGVVAPRLLPPPGKVWDTLGRSMSILMQQAQPTFWGVVAGIVIAAALGIALGIAVSYSRTLMQAVYPTIVFFQLIPKVALAPLFLIWFGTNYFSNVIFSVFVAFFPVLVATITGLDATPALHERLCRSLMMPRLKFFVTVKIPFALPFILNGMRIGVTFAIIGVVLGEFITAQKGLGYIILFSANNFETSLLLSAIAVLCGIGIVFFLMFQAIEAALNYFYDCR